MIRRIRRAKLQLTGSQNVAKKKEKTVQIVFLNFVLSSLSSSTVPVYFSTSMAKVADPQASFADDGSVAQQQAVATENLGYFAGDNFSWIRGDAKTQLFLCDAEKKLGMEGGVHV